MHPNADLTQLALDYLYGLLDDAEAADAEVRLQSPAGQQAWAEAKRIQGLMSAAARLQFPDAKFVVPSEKTATASASLRWIGWVVAASLLAALAIPGAAYVLGERHLAAQARAAVAQAEVEKKKLETTLAKLKETQRSAESEYQAAQQNYQRLADEKVSQIANVQREVRNRNLNVVVSGPAALTPGAPNQYQIETLTLAGRRTDAKVAARVVDQAGRVVYEPPPAESRGLFTLRLPPDLPLTPDRELALEVAATGPTGSKNELTQKLSLAPPIYFAHLSTDKPMYQPTETIRFRALVLDRFKLQPPTEDLNFSLAILDPQGSELVNLTGVGPADKLRGVLAGEYSLTESAPGGEYTLRLREAASQGAGPTRLVEQTRKFIVNRYRPDQLQKELEFTRKSYGAGDEVVAACKAKRVNGPVANQPVQAEAQVDGVALKVDHPPTTDAQGNILVKFRLPKEIQRGQASVAVVFTDGGAVEPIVKPVPVVVNKLSVEFYPEGGDLIAGVPNRIYFQARTPLGKPAQMSGRIVDQAGAKVAEVATLSDDAEPGINQGQGRFTFTPQIGVNYKLLVDNPAGIADSMNLPAAKDSGVVLETGLGVTDDQQPLQLRVTNVGSDRALMVGAYARGRLLAHERFTITSGQTKDIRLQPTPGFGGVTRVTVFEERGDGQNRELAPLAERLVFRKVNKKVNLTVAPNKLAYAPGEKVELKLSAKDETGKSVPTVTMLGVVNQSVVTMADEKTFRQMPTHFLLTAEVEKAEDLEHVDVLLGTHPKAETALDLLLGVQGWRRFAEKSGEAAANAAVASRGQTMFTPMMRLDSVTALTKQIVDERRPALQAAEQQLRDAQFKLAKYDGPRDEFVRQLQSAMAATSLAVQSEQKLEEHAAAARELGRHALPWLAGLGGASALMALILNWAYGIRSMVGPVGFFVAALASLASWMMIPPAAKKPDAQPSAPMVEELASHKRLEMQQPLDAAGVPPDQNFLHYFAELNGPERERLKNWGLQHPNMFLVAAMAGTGGANVPALAGDVDVAGRAGEQINAFRQLGDGMKPGDGRDNFVPEAPPLPGPGGGSPPMAPAGRGGAPKSIAAPAPATNAGADKKLDEDERRALGRNVPAEAGQPGAPKAKEETGAARMAKNPARNDAQPNSALAARDRGQLAAAAPPVGRPLREPAKAPALADAVPGIVQPQVGFIRQARDDDEAKLRGRFGSLERTIDGLIPISPFVVREYAHHHKPSADQVRDDFAETVYWHPALIVPEDGTTVAFELSDAISRYRVLAEAHTLDGRLGSSKSEIAARKPLTVEPKIPVEITAGDRIDIPVTIANETDAARDVKLSVESQGLVSVGPQPVVNWKQNANSRERRVFGYRPLHAEGQSRLRFALHGDDVIEVKIPIVAEGFPITGQFSDELRGEAKHTVTLPKTWVPGTLKCEVALYPTPLADLVRGLDGLLRDPYGCFEQTSTTNYPNTLILDYLRETGQANPETVARAKAFLDKGYARLTSFEVPAQHKREGFEWFGQAPAHEALTAYGLLQFRDMARVAAVDPEMLARTRNWLMSRRDGQGGFQRSKTALDSFGRASEPVTNAYIVWAITESGKEDDVTAELNRLETEARSSQDPYFLALVANALLNRDRPAVARVLLDRLAASQAADGSLAGTEKSITGSQGNALKIETTALAVLGWLKANVPAEYSNPTRKAVTWIIQQRQGQGNFGPTQSTIMALKSLVAFARAYKQPPEAGTMILKLGDQTLATADFAADRQDAIILEVPDAEKWLKPGDNALAVATTGKNFYPYTLSWSYQTLQPPSVAGCAVKVSTKLEKSELREGESTRLIVNLDNISGQGQGMTVAIIGLPAGLKLPDDFKQLRDMSRVVAGQPGPIAFFEVRGRELILYWRDLAPDAKKELAFDVIAHVPGRFRGPASRAYLYYDPELKYWTAPLAATVAAKE
jgi:hypothetical protein